MLSARSYSTLFCRDCDLYPRTLALTRPWLIAALDTLRNVSGGSLLLRDLSVAWHSLTSSFLRARIATHSNRCSSFSVGCCHGEFILLYRKNPLSLDSSYPFALLTRPHCSHSAVKLFTLRNHPHNHPCYHNRSVSYYSSYG